jgi:hypothetical protein
LPADQDLFDELDQRHPDYQRWSRNWKLFRDVLGESEPTLDEMKGYLPRGEFEDDTPYLNRLRFAQFVPESGIPVAKLVSAIYSRSPTRDVAPEFSNFVDDADMKGTNWDDCVERLARRLVGYGSTRLLVNLNRFEENGETNLLSVADERALGIRPYVINYSPLAVIYWELDRFGRPTVVRIREDSTTRALAGEGYDDLVRFIQYDENEVRWWAFRLGKTTTLEEREARIHGLGVVPMVIENFPEEIVPMVGGGFIRYIAKADVRKIRAESDLHWDTYVHAHPVAVYRGGDNLSNVGIGSSTILKIKIGEDLFYLQVPPSISTELREVIDMNLRAMHRHAGTDPLGQLQDSGSVFQASGVARAWSFGTSEGRILKQISLKMQRLEMRTLELVARYMLPAGTVVSPDEQVFGGKVQYPEEFDPSAAETLMQNTQQSAEIVNSEEFLRVMVARVATAIIGEVPDATRRKILAEIESTPLIVGRHGGPQVPIELELEEAEEDVKPEEFRKPRPGRQSRRRRPA